MEKKNRMQRKFSHFDVQSEQVEGEAIERIVERLLQGSEEVELTRQPYYPDKEFGVVPETDIRTDRHEMYRQAIEDANNAYLQAHRERIMTKFEPKNETPTDEK